MWVNIKLKGEIVGVSMMFPSDVEAVVVSMWQEVQ
jgi:hypothetical protein